MGLSGSAFGAEIKMTCDSFDSDFRILFKYQDKLIVQDKAYGRLKGSWIKACDAIDELVGQGLKFERIDTVKDNSVVCLHKYDEEHLPLKTTSWVIDFEAKTWAKYRDGYPYAVRGFQSSGTCK